MIFRILLEAPENKDMLISLLGAVLNTQVPIADVTVLNPSLPKEQVKDKGAVLDLRLRLSDDRLFDVEMQSAAESGLRNRVLYYWARNYGSQLEAGASHAKLQPCVSILITAFQELRTRRFHSTFQLLEIHGDEVFTDQLEMHCVELPKLPPPGDPEREAERALADWCTFFAPRTDEELQEAVVSNPMIAKEERALDRLAAKPGVRELAEERRQALRNYQNAMATARAEGQVEGRAEGRAEGKAEAILAVLQARGMDVPEHARAKIMACTDNAELTRWLTRAISVASASELFE